jgi:hypothetical protein
VRVSLLLADSAQADQSGKVHALGLGWTTTTTPLPPFALVIFLDIDWDETNQPHNLRCELLSEDGEPVRVPGPFGQQPIVVEAQAEAGRPPGAIHGTAGAPSFCRKHWVRHTVEPRALSVASIG